jgi:hypothetical protein
MGVQSGSDLLHSVSNISRDNLVTDLRHRSARRGSNCTPTICVDGNWLGYCIVSSKGITGIIALLGFFTERGLTSLESLRYWDSSLKAERGLTSYSLLMGLSLTTLRELRKENIVCRVLGGYHWGLDQTRIQGISSKSQP